MKIFVFVDNYKIDAGYYILPDTALNRVGQPYFLPDFDGEQMAFPMLAVRIGRLGKNISEKFSPRYIDAVAPAIVFRDERMLDQFRSKGLPWSPAVSFDGVVNHANWIPTPDDAVLTPFRWIVEHNGKAVQTCDSSDLLRSPEQLVSLLSRSHKLCQGDIVLTGGSEGFACQYDDEIRGLVDQREVLHFRIK
ncbi:MAG: fumarylacetoacetate hydrolase family protein [Alloprevotella sp.]|nr:fumarylacetoacetate hydrolase family protein [Alloprevotella sp.]